jgi:aerobic carbon-monoxide dehydrogenase large subunit
MASMVGSVVVRKEDPNLLTGRGKYTDDLTLHGMVFAAFARSSEAHADIVSIDTSEARSMPGVLGVWTAADLPDLPSLPSVPIPGLERPCLAKDRVRFVGEMVAVVVATTRYQAADAAASIVVDYAPRPVVATLEQALAGADEHIWPAMGGNAVPLVPMETEAAEAALSGCAHRFSIQLRNTRCAPVPMETNAYLADWSPTGLTMWLSTQGAHAVRNLLATTFGLGHHECRIITPEVGGGFGAKVPWYPEHFLIPLLSKMLNRPVKYSETRSENMLAMVHGRDQIEQVEVGCDGDGKVHVLKVQINSNVGSYADPTGFGLAMLTSWLSGGIYDIPQIFAGITNWFTNQMSLAAYRGAGRPEASFLIERAMDLIADELDLDPLAVRRRNMLQADQFPHTIAHTGGFVNYDSGDYPKQLDALMAMIDIDALKADQAARLADPKAKLLGIGFSTWLEIAGFGPRGSLEGFGHLGSWESARMRVLADGSCHITTGISPHGQGTYTMLSQIAADVTGIPFDKITVFHGDTDVVPQGIGTMGSRATPVAGGAVWTAGQVIVERARKIAAHLLEAAEEDIVMEGGAFHVAGSPDRSKSWAEIGTAGFQGASLPEGLKIGALEELTYFEPSNFTFPSGAYCCVVEIDRETGEIVVDRFIAVDDCGVIINPANAAGQVMGGVAQGIAQALYESVEFDPSTGQPLTGTLMNYLVPSAAEFPMFELGHTVTPTPSNPLGAKGLGESGAVGATPAVVNAVVDALSHLGVRDVSMPVTPEKVWKILNA